MKLKLNTAGLGSQAASETLATPSKPSGKISLKLGSKATPSATPTTGLSLSTPKSNGKARTNKRAREDDAPLSTNKKAKTAKPTLLRLKSSKSQAGTPRTPIAHLNIKTKGKPPVRPLGVGYDSEAEDAEDDPSIEENIILRMKPGPDCELLRRAVEERRLGAKPEDNGVRMSMRFFGKDGRRASVSVADSHYGAILVDLPTVTESMKSWDRRGWWKSSDICQMLLVLDRIQAPEDAKTMPLPQELDQKTWQWPHGLTPPMHNVRKRRFRKRVSYRTIEAAEQEVERLLAEDEKAIKAGGSIEHEVIDLDQLREQDEMDSEDEYEEEEDAEGDLDETQMEVAEEDDEEDYEADAARLALELGEDDEEDELAGAGDSSAAKTADGIPNAATTNGTLAPPPAPTQDGTSPAAGTTSGDNDEDEDEDDSGDDDDSDDDEQDEEAREEAQQKQQQLEDIAQLDKSILQQRQALNSVSSAIFRTRIASQIKSLEAERDVKRRAAGLEEEDGE